MAKSYLSPLERVERVSNPHNMREKTVAGSNYTEAMPPRGRMNRQEKVEHAQSWRYGNVNASNNADA